MPQYFCTMAIPHEYSKNKMNKTFKFSDEHKRKKAFSTEKIDAKIKNKNLNFLNVKLCMLIKFSKKC